ncbi:peptidoglycan recognition protein family protein, partial [Enterococcus sp. AZ128]
MKKKILLGAVVALFLLPINGFAYTVNNEFNLGASEGDSRLASQDYIILHETGNLREPSGRNEATYMRNNWRNAYTTDIVGDYGIDYRVGQWGYVSWGALNANPYGPVQIELEHTTNKAKFQTNYKAYIDLARDAAKTYNIPLTLDGSGRGIKSHWWVTQNYGGDHVDPYTYLTQMGISKAQLQHDLLYGVDGTSTPSTPSTPTGTKNGIAIDNVSKDQAVKMVQRVQTDYSWTLLRDQVKAVKQSDGRYTLAIRTGKGNRLNKSVNRLRQELRSYYPGYMQQNVAIVNGDKDSATIEARNMPASAFSGKNPFDVHMRKFLKDILLDGQAYAEANSYGTYDVRIKGEGFNDHDAPIVLKQIQEMG